MASFNYSRFRYFDKNGHELIIDPVSNVNVAISNLDINAFGANYAFIQGVPVDASSSNDVLSSSSLLQLKAGSRFNKIGSQRLALETVTTITNDGNTSSIEGRITDNFFVYTSYQTSIGEEFYPTIYYNNLNTAEKYNVLGDANLCIRERSKFFPTYTFQSKIGFSKISTGLIESQTIYVLVENDAANDPDGVPTLTTLKEYAETHLDASIYINRFKLLFFIDCRKQRDFRMFHVSNDEISWSDRSIMDFNKEYEDGSNDNGYSVNIGFSGENDGVYEQKLYVCLLDTSTADEGYPGDAYQIGEITMTAETEGEDERYRSFFTNFGIPDPKEYDHIFNETDTNEDLPDFESINRHSKKMFLSYSDIFPYIGSYKALINAVKYLGYEDEIFFKEWYKEIGSSTIDDKYSTYDIVVGSTINKNLIQNSCVDERVHLRKMNWLSMLYKMSTEIDDYEDQFGFPQVITNYRNFNTDKIMKLFGLKKWLEKYAIGVNCHITDIGGEGIVFERYNLQKFGSYQNVIDFNKEFVISPAIKNSVETIKDGSANIHVNLYTGSEDITIEDLKDEKFSDLCQGYFNGSNVFCEYDDNVTEIDSNRYFGKTFDFGENIESVELRAKGTHESYLYKSGIENSFIEQGFSSMMINDNRIDFDMSCDFNKNLNSLFTNLPTIEIESGTLKRYKTGEENLDELSFYSNIYKDSSNGIECYRIDLSVENGENVNKTYWLYETPTLLAPTFSKVENYVIISPPSKTLGIDGSIGNILIPYEHPYNFASFIDYRLDNISQWQSTNFGFRFCIDNPEGTQCFKIIGYEEKNIMLSGDRKTHFPGESGTTPISSERYEYFLEIKKGRIIFDKQNDLISVINFEFDEKTNERKIYVTTYDRKEYSSVYKYKVGDNEYVDAFSLGNEYGSFVEDYDNNTDEAIVYDSTKEFNVKHSGEYEISAITYNSDNCVFSKKAEGKCIVNTPSGELTILTADSSSNNAYNINGSFATQEDLSSLLNIIDSQEECIFDYTPKLKFENKSENSISYSGDLYETSLNNPTIATISSMSDRFDIPCYYTDDDDHAHKGFALVRRTHHGSHLFCDSSSEVNDMLSHLSIDSSTMDSILKNLVELSYGLDGTMFDATLFAYNVVGEYPMYSSPGVMVFNIEEPIVPNLYWFMPLSTTQADDIIQNFLGRTDVAFYVIPTWAIPVNFWNLSSELNTINLTTSYYPFTKTLKSGSMGMLHFLDSYNKSTNGTNFGHGSYRIIDTNIVDTESGSIVLEASQGKPIKGKGYNQTSIDCSIWFSSCSMDFMEYKLDVSNGNSEMIGKVVPIIDNNPWKKSKAYIDEQYSVSIRDFDAMYAMQIWDFDSSTYAEVSDIKTKYKYDIPVCTNKPFIGLLAKVSGTNLHTYETEPQMSIEWRIYKRVDGMRRKLVTKCMNNALLIRLIESGIYDVEFDIFDEFGNKYTKVMYNAVTYTGEYDNTYDDWYNGDYEQEQIPYGFVWGTYVCEQDSSSYMFAWDSSPYVCERRIPYGFAWDSSPYVCEQSTIPYMFRWNNWVCERTAPFTYGWSTSVCENFSQNFTYKWDGIECERYAKYSFSWSGEECEKITDTYEYNWEWFICELESPYTFKWNDYMCEVIEEVVWEPI